MAEPLTVALVAIARPTFDVALAQSVADTAFAHLRQAGFQVVGTGPTLIMDEAGALQARAALQREPYHALVLLQASFADSSMAVALAETNHDRGMPLLLWAVPEPRVGGRLRLNSLCGINLAGHALARRDLAYDYLLAAADDPAAVAKIEALARAGRARQALAQTRIGLVGRHPEGFDTCAYDGPGLARLFGAQVVPIPLEEALAQAATAPDEARRPFLERIRALADNVDSLDPQATAGTGGVYAALRQEAERLGLHGIAVRCWPEFFTELGCAACGAMSLLTEEGVPCSCEADVNGTLTLVMLQAMADGPAFITDLVHMDPETDTGVLWHCGLAPVSMADPAGPVRGTVHSNRKLPFLFEFTLKPGRVTLARLHYLPRHGYRLVVGGGEMVRAPMSFTGTSGVIRFDRPVPEVLDTVMREGLEHHFCIAYGDHREALRALARTVGLPVLDLC